MSNEGFDSSKFAELVRGEYPAPIARPFAFLAQARGAELATRAEIFVEALLRYCALIALRGAFAHDRAQAAALARECARPASKGQWLERLRASIAAWNDDAGVALFGPADATAAGFSTSRTHELLARLVALRNRAKYDAGAPREMRRAAFEALGEMWALREHRLFAPFEIESQSSGLRRYRATLYRGHAAPYPAIAIDTDLELELGRLYLGRRGSRSLLPLDPLFVEHAVDGRRELFVVARIDAKQCVATALESPGELPAALARASSERFARLCVGFAPQMDWQNSSRLATDDELPVGSRRFEVGDLIGGRYRVAAYLDSGASADVYAARDEREGGRGVALKVLPFELARSTTTIKKLANEVGVAMKARHENLVAILDHGIDRGDAYLVLELADGWQSGTGRARDLAAYLAERAAIGAEPLSEDVARSLTDDLARGLGALHANNTLHRDVKPGNVLLFGADENRPARAKLADFGISRATDAPTTTSEGFRVGTCRYMAPERLDATRASEVGEASDVYALGCVLYEALTGRPPFDGATERDIENLHRTARPASLRDLRPDVSPTLAALVHRCLAKSPAKRPRNGSAVLAALSADAPMFDEPEETLAAPDSVEQDAPRKLASSGRRLAWCAAAGAVALVAAAFMVSRAGAAASFAERIVADVCLDSSPKRAQALLKELIHVIDAQRTEIADPQQRTPVIGEIADALRNDSRLSCVIGGFARMLESREEPLFDTSESLWRLVTALANEACDPSLPRADLDRLGLACRNAADNDSTLRFVASVRMMPLELEWAALDPREDSGRTLRETKRDEWLRRSTSLAASCREALKPRAPRMRHDQDGLLALVLANIARIDASECAEARRALEAFASPEYQSGARDVIERVFPATEVVTEVGALEDRLAQVRQLLKEPCP